MTKTYIRPICLLLVGVLASCTGGQNLITLPFAAKTNPSILSAAKASKKSAVTLAILIPAIGTASKRTRTRHHHYVSPATQSIAIAVSSTTGVAKTFVADLTPARNKNCKALSDGINCVLTLVLTHGRYIAEISTYDGPIVRGQPTGSELSSNQNVPFRVRAHKASTISFSLGGIPTSVAFLPGATSQLVGSVSGGYSLPRCQPTAQPVSAFGADADGNIIVGAGAPSVTMRSGSSSLVVAAPRPGAPNLFVLKPPTPPSYPAIGSTTYLEVLVNPNSNSGAKPVFAIVKITFTTEICGVVTEFPIPSASSGPWSITAGDDGALWFIERGSNKIARIPTTATAANPGITEFPVPTASAGLWSIAADANGAIWFTECARNQIGRMTESGPPILEFPLGQNRNPQGIARGPDGALWFAEAGANAIGRVPMSGSVTVREYPVPTASSEPVGIAAGPDGALWFTEFHGGKIGRIPTSGGPITESTTSTPNSGPHSIAAGPDNALWFTETASEKFGRVTALAGSPVQEYSTATLSDVWGVTAGPDGAMWFAEPDVNTLYRVTTDGAISSYPLPSGAGPLFVTTGPDGNLWFTETYANKIGRMQ